MPTSALIFDIVILAVLLIFALRGASRGLLLSLCSLLAVIVAFIGASFVSDLFTPAASKLLRPSLEPAVTAALDSALPEGLDSMGRTLEGLDRLLDADLPYGLDKILNDLLEDGLTLTESLVPALTTGLAQSVAHGVLFLASFVVILVLWAVLSHALDLVTRLPGLNTLNRTGGALFGLLKGSVLLFLCAWALNTFWPVIPKETVEETRLLRFFLTTNPVSLLLTAMAALPKT